MTVFNTFYTMVDGLFVSNLICMEALSAINLTAPAIALITAVSGMLATGGSALFIGCSYGMAPMMSYYHGEQNREKLKKLVGFSIRFIVGASVLCAVISILATVPLVSIFTRPDSPVYELAVTGNRLCSLALPVKYRKRYGY